MTKLTAQEIELKILTCELDILACIHLGLPNMMYDMYEADVDKYYKMMKEHYPQNCR